MEYKVYKYNYTPSSSHSITGVRGGCIPPDAVRGGNGSFIVAKKAKIELKLRNADNPDDLLTIDIAPKARYVAYEKGIRLTKARANNVGQYFVNEVKVVDVENGEIAKLEEILEKIIY